MESPRDKIRPNESEHDADDLLPPFLRTLAERIEQKQLGNEQLRRVGEFFMSYLFEEQVELDNKGYEESVDVDKDFKKFLVLGWYAYSHIIPQVLDNIE